MIRLTRDELLGLLDDIDEHGVGLTDWEADFIDSMLKHRAEFSDGQAKMIRRIYKERVLDEH